LVVPVISAILACPNAACIFPFPRLASLIFVARASTPTLKTAGYAGYTIVGFSVNK
jgi:hypothetical protein